MRHAAHRLVRIIIQLMTGTRRKQRIVIIGMRRSGNHALTSWLTNAAEMKDSELTPLGQKPPLSHCHVSPTGSVVLFNEMNELDFISTLRLVKHARKWTRKCTLLMVGLEDIRPSEYLNFRRLSGTEIRIRRKTLEILSSRYHRINQKANLGVGWSRQSCDSYFVEALREVKERDASALTWDYNDWLDSATWRGDFLKQLDMSMDLMPSHSPIGGGSSFHGTSGRVEKDLTSRLQKVQPQEHWRSFLQQFVSEYPELFEVEEQDVIKQFLSKT